MRRSAPHPAIRKTPRGGTVEEGWSQYGAVLETGFRGWRGRGGGEGEGVLKMVTMTTRMAETGSE